jgi:ubiquinone/menaquinone biosynthesis C-methylase UbiE
MGEEGYYNMETNPREREIQDRLAAEYNFRRYNLPHSLLYAKMITERIAAMVDWEKRENWTVLDDGCGVGQMVEWLKKEYPTKITPYGMDLSINMVKYAVERCGGSFCQADSQELPYRDETFDVVFARGLLHHLPRPERGFSEIMRVLKPGGRACFMDPNKGAITTTIRKAFQSAEKFSKDHKDFNAGKYRNMIEKGADIDTFQYFGYVAYPILGAPDIMNVFSIFHLPLWMAKALIKIDDKIGKIPLIKNQSFGLLTSATKI